MWMCLTLSIQYIDDGWTLIKLYTVWDKQSFSFLLVFVASVAPSLNTFFQKVTGFTQTKLLFLSKFFKTAGILPRRFHYKIQA